MSDFLKHECGIAMIRLLKPLDYYVKKYGNVLYGFNQLYLLMEKQHNRGQDGAGVGCLKLDTPVGKPYLFRERNIQNNSLAVIFNKLLSDYQDKINKGIISEDLISSTKQNFNFGGEILLGHLRYGTSGVYTSKNCHPFVRKSNWPTKSLMLAGNFTITNEKEINKELINRGQHPVFNTDTQAIIEELGFHLDEAHDSIYREMKKNIKDGESIPEIISEKLDPLEVIKSSAKNWDGGYTIAGIIGNGDSFVIRDPNGIRPCSYLMNDEIIAFASERAALMTIFNKDKSEIKELEPGNAMIIKRNGKIYSDSFIEKKSFTSCSFERIYFSRGNDPDIYQERKALGSALKEQIVDSIDSDFGNSVFSFIPNTAEIAYYGLLESLRLYRRKQVKDELMNAHQTGKLDEGLIDKLIMGNWPRGEQIAHKDVKLRTFISQEKGRSQLVSHVYDITYGVVGEKDNLVVIDDSIVRGTTLKESILKILSRTNPKKIIIASTAPQIRYPDCYGIDMSKLANFIAFKAAVELVKDDKADILLEEIYQDCLNQKGVAPSSMKNHVKRIYDRYTDEQISNKIAEIVYPKDVSWNGELEILFLKVDKMKKALIGHDGDWYFTGNYPTRGGYRVLNKAYINFYENNDCRAYE